MAKGSPRIFLRLPPHVARRVERAVLSQNRLTRDRPLNRSEWIRRAIERELAHRERSSRKNRRKRKGDSP